MSPVNGDGDETWASEMTLAVMKLSLSFDDDDAVEQEMNESSMASVVTMIPLTTRDLRGLALAPDSDDDDAGVYGVEATQCPDEECGRRRYLGVPGRLYRNGG